MTEGRFVDEFLSELKASLTEPSGAAVLRRIDAERLLRLLVEEFLEIQGNKHVRVLPDSRLVEEDGNLVADFLFQIDDYDVRVELLDAPNGKPVLALDQVKQFRQLLEDNPNTTALIVTWSTDD